MIGPHDEYTIDPSGNLAFKVRTRPSLLNPEVPETSVAGSYYCQARLVDGGPAVVSERVTLTLACMHHLLLLLLVCCYRLTTTFGHTRNRVFNGLCKLTDVWVRVRRIAPKSEAC